MALELFCTDYARSNASSFLPSPFPLRCCPVFAISTFGCADMVVSARKTSKRPSPLVGHGPGVQIRRCSTRWGQRQPLDRNLRAGEWPRKICQFVHLWYGPIRRDLSWAAPQIGKSLPKCAFMVRAALPNRSEEAEDHEQRPQEPGEPARRRERSREPEGENPRKKGKKEVDQQNSTL